MTGMSKNIVGEFFQELPPQVKGWATFGCTVSMGIMYRQLLLQSRNRKKLGGKAESSRKDSPRSTKGDSAGLAVEKDLDVGTDVTLLGMSFSALPPARPSVTEVLPDTWAQQVCISPGDQLLRIDGIDVERMQREEFITAIRKRPLQLSFMLKVGRQLDSVSPASTKADSVTTSAAEKNVEVDADVQVLGMSFEALPPTRPVVTMVVPDSWAEKVCIVVGDQLLRVDGVDVEKMGRDDFFLAMHQRPLQLTFKDESDLITDASECQSEEGAEVNSVEDSKVNLAHQMNATEAPKSASVLEVEVGVNEYVIGLSFDSFPPAEQVLVSDVIPGTWAEAVGVSVGDELLSMDGRDVKKMQREEFLLAIRARPLPLTLLSKK